MRTDPGFFADFWRWLQRSSSYAVLKGLVLVVGALALVGWISGEEEDAPISEFCGYECGCLRAAPLTALAVGRSFDLQVNAGDPWNASGLTFERGGVYAFEVKSNSWKDKSRDATEDGWIEPLPILIQLTQPLWREPSQPLFRLMGTVHARCEADSFCTEVFPIRGKGGVEDYTAPMSGAFCAFANDLPNMYHNNSGALNLRITRKQ